jgi:hypothetical protein
MSVPEGQKGHCSLCDQRLGFPSWVEPPKLREEPKTIRVPPDEPLIDGWIWVFEYGSWGAQALTGPEHCYLSQRHNLIACVGRIPFSVKVAVSNVTGVSAL